MHESNPNKIVVIVKLEFETINKASNHSTENPHKPLQRRILLQNYKTKSNKSQKEGQKTIIIPLILSFSLIFQWFKSEHNKNAH